MTTEHIFEKLVRENRAIGLQQGLSQGLSQGALAVSKRMSELRLARPLTEGETEALRAKLRDRGAERVSEVVFLFAPTELLAWLADPAAQ